MPPSMTAHGQSLTHDFIGEILARQHEDLPPAISEHARIHLLNVLALAVSASGQPAVEAVVQLQAIAGGAGVCAVPGRTEQLDRLLAPVAIGVAAHLDDFDDTHLATVIHPSAAALATVLPIGLLAGSSGAEILRAFAWGCEAQLRVGLAMSPSHYDVGWHITGTAGVVGSAISAGLLLGLDASAMACAVGIAASSAVGHRQAFGTMTKALHVGKAASNGVLAALLARDGFTGPGHILEAPRGYFHVMAEHTDPDIVLDRIGEVWQFADDVVKPYPCGIVAHPLIDAGLLLHERGVEVDRVVRLKVSCNPLVPDLMGNLDPLDGLQARFSAVHGLAVALLDGQVGLPAYETDRVRAADAIALRARVDLVPDPSCDRDYAEARAELDDGSSVTVVVAHARGSMDRPLSRAEVLAKAQGLLTPTLGDSWHQVVDAVEALPLAPNLHQLLASTTAPRSMQ
jgi:2-methylcitrate dehydratase PrpD